jgi:hypothetical protein
LLIVLFLCYSKRESGSLTLIPAVRNFSICPATAVLLDFILQ